MNNISNCFRFIESFFEYPLPLDFLFIDDKTKKFMDKLLSEKEYIRLLVDISLNETNIVIKENSENAVYVSDNLKTYSILYSSSDPNALESILSNTIAIYALKKGLDENSVFELFTKQKQSFLDK